MAYTGEQVGVLADEERGSLRAAGLLSTGGGEDEVARRRRGSPRGTQHGGQDHGQPTLHVQGSATPDVPVDELARERRVPPHARRGHDVGMAVQQERGSCTATRNAGDDVRALVVHRDDARLEPPSRSSSAISSMHASSFPGGFAVSSATRRRARFTGLSSTRRAAQRGDGADRAIRGGRHPDRPPRPVGRSRRGHGARAGHR